MKPLCVCSNMLNERPLLDRWLGFVKPIADGGILVVDGGSEDGTAEYLKENGVTVIIDAIIQRDGYGPARNHLRDMARKNFPDAHWCAYFDADETISEKDFHRLRYLKDYLIDLYDVVALPRIDWHDEKMTKAENDWRTAPDPQARMTRLKSNVAYIRRLHEQIVGHRKIFTSLTNPKINHFHRSTSQEKRDFIGRLCSKLHSEDVDWGSTYGKHHKEDYYYEQYLKQGL